MINIPRSQTIAILLICLAGLVFALPNVFSRETASKLPSWWRQFNYGLDLQGGAYLLLEANMREATRVQIDELRRAARVELRDAKVRYENLAPVRNGIAFKVVDRADLDKAREAMRKVISGLDSGAISLTGAASRYSVAVEGETVALTITDAGLKALAERVIEQSIEIVRRRIDPDGTREPTIQRQGASRIIVELAGIKTQKELDEAKDRIRTAAKMTFHLVNLSVQPTDMSSPVPRDTKVLHYEEAARGVIAIYEEVALDGKHIVDAQQTFQDGRPIIAFRLDNRGGLIFCDITRNNVNKPFAIVLDNKVLSAPVIQTSICGGSGIITGGFTIESAQTLALLLRAGALEVPLTIVEERTVGAGLGQDAIEAGKWAAVLGLALVVVVMFVLYGLFGLFANIALVFNVVILAAVMSAMQATLTLPGIAGIVLMMGMAVDANVLIYARMRDEIRLGRTPLSAIDSGFRRAMSAIVDANLTTIIAALLLYIFGTGPVKGFGITLTLGLIISMFTAVMLTRVMVVYWWRWRKPKTLPI
jgi:preprotein translocase subunit SecD